MANYKYTIETQQESVLRVTWEDDDGNVIVSGEKKIKGDAKDLKKNFQESVLRVTWEDDDGNVIVSGEKKIKGDAKEAKKLEKAFAKDLKKNFQDRFPITEPVPMEGELE